MTHDPTVEDLFFFLAASFVLKMLAVIPVSIVQKVGTREVVMENLGMGCLVMIELGALEGSSTLQMRLRGGSFNSVDGSIFLRKIKNFAF